MCRNYKYRTWQNIFRTTFGTGILTTHAHVFVVDDDMGWFCGSSVRSQKAVLVMVC